MTEGRAGPAGGPRREGPRLALVTGGTGFVGSHLVDELLDEGYRVRAAVRATSDTRWLDGKDVERVQADLSTDDLGALVEGVDVTFHVAGLTRGSPATLERANVHATRRLLEALGPSDEGHRFVLCSSMAAAGPGALDAPRGADAPPDPTSDYGRSKLAAERLLADAGDALRASVLRLVAVYGPRDRDTLPFFQMARRGIAVTPGLRRRQLQLVHARDAAAAMRLAAERPEAVGRTFFVGHPELVEWPRMMDAMRRAVGRNVLAVPMPSPGLLMAGMVAGVVAGGRAGQLDYRRARDMVERAWTCDVEPAMHVLGWTPGYDVVRGFKDTADWYQEEGWM